MQLASLSRDSERMLGVQAAEDMIVRTQDHLQALTVVDAKAKKQQEADCTRSLSLVRAEKEAHDRYELVSFSPHPRACGCDLTNATSAWPAPAVCVPVRPSGDNSAHLHAPTLAAAMAGHMLGSPSRGELPPGQPQTCPAQACLCR